MEGYPGRGLLGLLPGVGGQCQGRRGGGPEPRPLARRYALHKAEALPLNGVLPQRHQLAAGLKIKAPGDAAGGQYVRRGPRLQLRAVFPVQKEPGLQREVPRGRGGPCGPRGYPGL